MCIMMDILSILFLSHLMVKYYLGKLPNGGIYTFSQFAQVYLGSRVYE